MKRKTLWLVFVIILTLGLTGCNRSVTITKVQLYDGTQIQFGSTLSGVSNGYSWKFKDSDFTEKGLDEMLKLNLKIGDRVKIVAEGFWNPKIDHIELLP